MQEQYSIFIENQEEIKTFIAETISNTGNLSEREHDNFKKIFKIFPSLELVYICNYDENVKQISSNIHRHKTNDQARDRPRKYLLKKLNLTKEDIDVSQPYLSGATGQICITVAKREGDKIYFLDLNLTTLLKRLSLLEIHSLFTFSIKAFYVLIGIAMMILALSTIGYSAIEFYTHLFVKKIVSIESIFKPVIALTLGLAIFDLARTVLEQEVIFKTHSTNNKNEYKVLTRFSITIIVALLIESLMVVFKIAINDYSNMIQAFYLVSGISLLIASLAFFIYISNKNH